MSQGSNSRVNLVHQDDSDDESSVLKPLSSLQDEAPLTRHSLSGNPPKKAKKEAMLDDWVPTGISVLARRRSRELGLSIQDLVRRSGLSRSHLYRVLDGSISDPSVRTLCRLADALELSPLALFRHFTDWSNPRHRPHRTSHSKGLTDPLDMAALVPDPRHPDQCVAAPGTILPKTWMVQNVGGVHWRGRKFVRQDQEMTLCKRERGVLVPLPAAYLSSLSQEIKVPDTGPGSICVITTQFMTPAHNCATTAVWRMVDAAGQACFHQDFVLQMVVSVEGG